MAKSFIEQSGKVTPGHIPQWVTTGVQSDSGIAVSDIHTTANNSNVVSLRNVDSVTLVPGQAVYLYGAGTVKRAKADAFSTGGVVGLASASIIANASGSIIIGGVVTLTAAQWNVVTGGSGGLTVGSRYFLDPSTAGRLTTTSPTTPGQVNTLIGLALSSVQLLLSIEPPVLL